MIGFTQCDVLNCHFNCNTTEAAGCDHYVFNVFFVSKSAEKWDFGAGKWMWIFFSVCSLNVGVVDEMTGRPRLHTPVI